MNIGITGASGFIGRHVINLAKVRGHSCIAFSRSPDRAVAGCIETRRFSLKGDMDVSGCDALVHLAGESLVGFWTESKKERIYASRVEGTRSLIQSIRAAENPPTTLICGSATGYYGDTGHTAATEKSPPGAGFLTKVCLDWEAEAEGVRDLGVRLVTLRTGMVLGPDGGAFPLLKPLFKLGLGAELGDGDQWMAWIHVTDEAALVLHAVEHENIDGVLNAVSPEPVQNSEFTTMLADALGRPAFLRVPAAVLRVALGGLCVELLDSSRVRPERTLETGFPFQFPALDSAFENILNT